MNLDYREQLLSSIPEETRDLYEMHLEEIFEITTGFQLRISNLFIYPIKSLKGLELNRADICDQGLSIPRSDVRDRMAMLVKRKPRMLKGGVKVDGERLSQREFPALVKIHQEYESKTASLLLSLPGYDLDDYRVPVNRLLPRNDSPDKIKMNTEGELCDSVLENGPISEWFRKALHHLGYPSNKTHEIHLATPPLGFRRSADLHSAEESHAQTRYSDGGQVLVTALPTLRWLQELMNNDDSSSREIAMEAFRPNIVLDHLDPEKDNTQLAPNAEDWIKALSSCGSGHVARLLLEKLCVRCPVTMVDQQTGERLDKEPLRSLKKFRPLRPDSKKVTFGVNGFFEKGSAGVQLKKYQVLVVKEMKG